MPEGGFGKCIDLVVTAGGAPLGKKGARALLEKMDGRAQRISRESGGVLSHDQALAQAAEEIKAEADQAAAIARRNTIENLHKRIARRGRLDANGIRDAWDGMRAEIHGINSPDRPAARFGAQQEWHSLATRWVNRGLTAELDRAGLFAVAQKGLLDEQIAQEMGELTKGAEGKPGISGSEPAQKIAAIYHRYLSLAKEAMNDAGAWIGDYLGYVNHTNHNPDVIRRAGAEQWIADTMPLLDKERTFEGIDDPQQFLHRIWDDFVSGVHMTAEGMVGMKDPAFTGPGNAAKRASQSRVLHWKDAQSWHAYQRMYGERNLGASVLTALDRSAKWTAIMRRWGTNPRAEFEADMRWLEQRYTHTDPEGVAKFRSQEHALQNRFDELDGTMNMPVHRTLAKFARGWRLLDSMALLGNVAFTHLSVGMTRAAELWHHGVSPLESYRNFITSYVHGRGRGEERELYRQLGAASDGAVTHLINRFDPDESIPGLASSMAATFMRWTGLTWEYDVQKGGMKSLLAYNLGRNLDKRISDLEPGTQRMLGMYGIGEREWDLLRAASARNTFGGKTYLFPDDALRIGDEAALAHLRETGALAAPEGELAQGDAPEAGVGAPEEAGISVHDRRAIDRFREGLGTRLEAYLEDSAERGMIQPGVEDRAILLQGTKPGTPAGELLRFMAQFKVWPTALVTKGLGREVYTSPTWKGAAVGLTQMAVAGAVFGYLRMVAADGAEGKSIRDPRDPRTWEAAFAQGGGLGILGDFLFGQYNRFGQDFMTTMAGPAGADANFVVDAFMAAKEGKNIEPRVFNELVNHIPYANLFYLHAALDYLLIWRINEWMRPGWARRYQSTVEKQNAQTFWLSPSRAVQ